MDDVISVKKSIWEGVIDIGQPVNNDSWFPGKFKYFDGYIARRKLLYLEHEYSITCKIRQSSTNRPLFECIATENDCNISRTTATNPTTAAKKLLQLLGVTLSFKNGCSFFGLDRQDVINMQSNVKSKISTDNGQEQFQEQPCSVTHAVDKHRQASWFGVTSFGTPNYDQKYLCTFGGASFRLQPGYEALRCINLPNESEVILHCKIEEENYFIAYRCFTVEHPLIDCKSLKPTAVVKEALMLLGVHTKKKWSGHDFFGFMKSDVLNILTKPEIKQSKIKKTELDPVLKLGMQVRSRNAGETSSLKNAKSIKHRNETIHKLVEYVGFGDVKSK